MNYLLYLSSPGRRHSQACLEPGHRGLCRPKAQTKTQPGTSSATMFPKMPVVMDGLNVACLDLFLLGRPSISPLPSDSD